MADFEDPRDHRLVQLVGGATIMLVVTYALSHGRRSAVPTALGVVSGDFVAMTASIAGLGVLLATSAALFTVLKWVGGAYLIYLGIRLWMSKPDDEDS